ncbi:unnamed protein product [Didymodactylos carnosus]|uniref:Calcineurin-like phosphoesterase domain-containing protein n=1 Tax=Didymodactylos carnosus TaxID=1234261 RepID=A0A814EI82_9BILA|nr:unnamed protein product [Didymodactylos carnosus]CAF3741610.1 unnamed protein product [Didymodactylos carnosus]
MTDHNSKTVAIYSVPKLRCCQLTHRKSFIIAICFIFILCIKYVSSQYPLLVILKWLLMQHNVDHSPFLNVTGKPDVFPDRMPINLTIAYVADTSLWKEASLLYNLIRSESQIDALVVSGDLDYVDQPLAREHLLTKYFGSKFPIFSCAGNHDHNFWPKYQQTILDRWKRSGIHHKCSGIIGVAHMCTYKGLIIIQIAPGIFEKYRFYDYSQYLENQLNLYHSQWKICSWHKNQHNMQLGNKQDETGYDVYNTCLKHGAMIITGHEHSYSRTYLMKGLHDPIEVLSRNSTYIQLSNGSSVVIVNGLGGFSVSGYTNNSIAPYWASVNHANINGHASALICKYNFNGNMKQALCYLKDIVHGKRDQFIIDVTNIPMS